MPEPTTTTTATIIAAAATVPVLSIAGVPLGIRPDLLMAGFAGSLAAIVLFNSVPTSGDTWEHLVRTTLRRMFVVMASSLTAGYLAPISLLIANLPDPLLLGTAFGVGGGAQNVLISVIRRVSGPAKEPPQ